MKLLDFLATAKGGMIMGLADVSIILPVYNTEQYLSACLESIINQSFKNIEIICVDDGSTDASVRILNDYQKKDSRIIVLHNSHNRGQGFARNRGLKVARGKYVFFADSDDIVKKDAMKYLVTVMEEDLDGILFSAECYSEINGVQKNFQKKKNIGEVFSGIEMLTRLLKDGEYTSAPWCQFWKRDYLYNHRILFWEDNLPHEDVMFSLKAILSARKIKCIKNSLYTYYLRQGSTTHTKMDERRAFSLFVCYIEILRHLKKIYSEIPLESAEYISKFAVGFRNAAWDAYLSLCKNGFDIADARVSDHYQFVFHACLLTRYSCIRDFLPKEHYERIRLKKYIIIYGLGKVGREVRKQMTEYGFQNIILAVTNKLLIDSTQFDERIYDIEELRQYKDESIVLISATKQYQEEMIQCLQDSEFTDYICMA